MSPRSWRGLLLAPVLSASAWCGADLSSYRGFTFGAPLATVAQQIGQKPADATFIHRRPAVIQEMEWRQLEPQTANASRPDPVRGGTLSFFDGKLYRMVVTYDRFRIEGLTAEDMIDAICQEYGAAQYPKVEIPFHSNYGEAAKVLARWENSGYAYDLVRTGDQSSFALVLYAKDASLLAAAGVRESIRLDALAAPLRALEEEKARLNESRVALEKARAANKPNFRP